MERIVAAPVWQASATALEDTCRRGIPGYDPWRDAGECRFDHASARRALDFFTECLRHVEGEKAGQPLMLEPWQAAIIGNLFGWLRPDGTRRYRTAFVYVPRKNGKTMLAAGVALYCGMADGEPGPQVYSAAAEKEQAALIFRDACGMIQQEPELAARCRIYRTFKSIEFRENSGIYRSLSADADTKHGFNSHCVIVDELHAHPTRDLVDVLGTSTGARRQPLMFIITTADYERESVCNEFHDYAKKVRDGVLLDPWFLPVVYEATKADDWTSPDVWRRVNPNFGISVKADYLAEECEKAKKRPAYLNTFLRLHLNLKTDADVAWFPADQWRACAGPKPWQEFAGWLKGRDAYGALDLASTTDLAAWVLAFPLFESDGFPRGGFAVVPRFFIPQEGAVEREKRDRVPYLSWQREGAIVLTPGNVTDYAAIEAQVLADCREYGVRCVTYDRWNASDLINRLGAEGVECVAFGQGFASMSAPAKALEGHVVGATLRHGQHPVLAWNAANVMTETDAAGNIKPSKKRSRQRIDGIVALVMALGGAILKPPEPPREFGGVWRL